MGASLRWGGLRAGQVCDEENDATKNHGADGLQAASWDVAAVPNILFLRPGIIELETKRLDGDFVEDWSRAGLLCTPPEEPT